MGLFLVGVDHFVAPLEVRERLAIGRERRHEALKQLHALPWVEEVILVTTCNRTELYVLTPETDGRSLTLDAFRGLYADPPPADSGVYRVWQGPTAAQHLFRVAAGLESAILGETEIQGQVREAHEAALEAGTAGRVLERLARGALKAGKRARTETAIASGGVSHGSAAATVVRRVFGDNRKRSILVVGAGLIARQTARALAEGAPASFLVANRTSSHAEELARELPDAQAASLDVVEQELRTRNVVVLAGGVGTLPEDLLSRSLKRRREPVLVLDLSLPRMAPAAVGDLPGVFLYDLDALERLVAGALSERREAVPAAEAILAEEFEEFLSWHRTLPALPAIHSLNEWAEAVRQAEVSYLPGDLSPQMRAAVEKMTKRLVQKLLGRPAARVVEGMSRSDPKMPTPEHLRSVFGLDEQEVP